MIRNVEEERPVIKELPVEIQAGIAESNRKAYEAQTRRPDVQIVATDLPVKYQLIERYRELAERLCAKFPEELENAAQVVNNILFVRNSEDRPKYQGRPKGAAISKFPARVHDILYQTTGLCVDYVLEVYPQNWMDLSQAHITLLIYHQLRHIDREGKIRAHDLEEWREIEERIGADWPHLQIPDLLAEGVTWETVAPRGLLLEPGQNPHPKLPTAPTTTLPEQVLKQVEDAAKGEPGDPSTGLITVTAAGKSATVTMDQFKRAGQKARRGLAT